MHNGYEKSQAAFAEAKKFIPGGVNSPVRAFRAVGTEPVFIERGEGSRMFDIDGNEYIDYVLSWGPLILGHAHPEVTEAVIEYTKKGTSYGAPTLLETEMAKLVVDIVPSVEIVRMVNSGTEATMSALRLARGYTKRSKIIKFEGCYHGHADSLLIKAGSGVATLGLPDSPGVPESVASNTLTVPFNDIESLKLAFEKFGEDIAAVIIEPVAGNMGCVLPKPGYLPAVRQITREYGTLLIFDEVMTGFRVAYGGAQAYYDIDPDLTTLGKVIGGGLPVGAYGGKKEIMEMIAPAGPIYQAGTLSGNPLAMIAGYTTLKLLGRTGVYEELAAKSRRIADGFKEATEELGIPSFTCSVGGMFGCFFTDTEVVDYSTAKTSNLDRYGKYFREMLKRGVYLAPSQLEAGFTSLAHTVEDIDRTLEASREALKAL
ncbi:glutamate-1-semialdehyde 2,1-aminomutase [Effusibacillus lacus]|uniref:Glutamate-1-semialdehyde 2,1-aminomutase n=1 Tax=Effusibacillus lacus TaxID=1348429 RepID=A0A292YPT7_9BACL|nr:glutamate-1-semialdehyde 2,1-aminomutase [Effusibacillus lacus]TCS76477.1 glutamate-1-semialdehyde 2,1-aminomutase [Effusibacillus lacus]GAX90500.1 aspartate aminotransferase family protein [Effusibacillus lacus]